MTADRNQRRRPPAGVLALRQRGKAIDARNRRIAERTAEEARLAALLERLKASGRALPPRSDAEIDAAIDAAIEQARRGPPKSEPASGQAIYAEMVAVYDDAEKRGVRPPNKVELVVIVKRRLHARNMTAKNEAIRKVSDRPEFAARRWQRGKHYKQRLPERRTPKIVRLSFAK
jgi:hypothetical protein